jgi:ATP-dependent DNA helicase RecG
VGIQASLNDPDSPSHSDEDSMESDDESRKVNSPESREFGTQSGELTDAASVLAALPSGLREEVTKLGKRATEERLRDLVRRLCAWRDLPLSVVAGLLQRNESYLQTRVVTPMVREKKIEFTIPDEPNHPRQTYRAQKKPGDKKRAT